MNKNESALPICRFGKEIIMIELSGKYNTAKGFFQSCYNNPNQG